MKKINKEKGFTLIEILVTILIISIIFGIGTYFLINTINTSKTKSEAISLNNIKSSAVLYSKEYPNNLIWEENGENKYACVTIQDLINSGYYKEKNIEEITDINHIILTKNKNNAIINEELDDNHKCELPSNQYMIEFNPNFTITEEQEFPEIESQICMKNEECELNGVPEGYTRSGYKFMGWSKKKTGKAEYKDKQIVTNLTKNKVITLYAIWQKNKIYIRYNVTDGKIEPQTIDKEGKTNTWSATENGIIKKNGKGYIDYYYDSTLEYGLADYNNKKNINITKAGHKAVPEKEWCTEPNGKGTCYDQSKELTNIGTSEEEDKLCDARIDDCTINLYLNWEKNTITVRYHPNDGTLEESTTESDGTKNEWETVSDGTIRKKTNNGNEELQVLKYGSTTTGSGLINYNNKKFVNIKRTGHIAVSDAEWCTHENNEKDGQKVKCFSQGNQKIPANELCDASEKDCTAILYVNWRKTRVYFRFYDNEGGTVTETTTYNNEEYHWTKDEEGALMFNTKNDPEYKYIKNAGIAYDGSIDLINYNGRRLKIEIDGDKNVPAGKEWCTTISENKVCYNQDTTYTNIGKGTDKKYFCDARENDCRVDLYLGWNISKFRVKYNANGGKGKLASKTCERGKKCTLDNNSYTKKGHKFIGWNTKADGSGKQYEEGASVKDKGKEGDIITFYAQWEENEIIIRYHPNGGNVPKEYNGKKFTKEEDGTIRKNGEEVQKLHYGGSTGTVGLANYDTFFNITKEGQTGKEKLEWCTKKNGGGKCYSQTTDIDADELCDASKEDCTIVLYVNWRNNKVIVRYHPNKGTVAPTTGNNQWTIVKGSIRKNGGEVQTLNYGGTSSHGLYKYNGSYLKITKTGYHAYSGKEWCKKNDNGELDQSQCYNQNEELTNVGTGTNKRQLCDARKEDCIADIYVNWQSNPTIKFSPIEGNYQTPQKIDITCSASAGIKNFETHDEKGESGVGSGNQESITLTSIGKRTITATCTSKSGKTVTVRKNFEIYANPPKITFDPDGGSYQTPKYVTIKCSAGANNLTAYDDTGDTASKKDNDDSKIIKLEKTGARKITATCTNPIPGGPSKTVTKEFTINPAPTPSNPPTNQQTPSTTPSTNQQTQSIPTISNPETWCCCPNSVCFTDHYDSNVVFHKASEEIKTVCGNGYQIVRNSCPSNGGSSSNNNGGGCFLAGTKVITEEGYKDIDKIKRGDKVLTYNEVKKINEYKKVLRLLTYKNINEELYELTFKDNTLKLTGKHNVYIVNKNNSHYVRAMDLKVGDKVMYSDGTYHKILKITHQSIKETVYNLTVSTNQNFYAENILVHNSQAAWDKGIHNWNTRG